MFTIQEFIDTVQELINEGKADPNGLIVVSVYNANIGGFVTAIGSGDDDKNIYVGIASEV